jgi:steroid delta-isomerase-like uncharacterized protein
MAHAKEADMTHDQVTRKAVEALNRHDADGYASLFSPDAVVHDPMYTEPLKGRDAIARDMTGFFAAFPDLEARLIRTIGDATGYAVEMSIRGTHEGPLAGPDGTIPATHKRAEFPAASVARLDTQGQIAEERRYYDLAGILHQLGVMAGAHG